MRLDISTCQYQILDEGDKMLDMGFDEDIKTLQRYMPSAQTMIFSATVPEFIQAIAMTKLKEPILIDLVGTNETQLPDTIRNMVIVTNSDTHKHALLADYIKKNPEKKVLVFCETKKEVRMFEGKTYGDFLPLHGDMEQSARLRALSSYKNPRSKQILVATDVAARGLDVNDIDVVVQFSVRQCDSFVHRSGRTGRANKEGTNIVFCQKADLPTIKEFEKQLKIKMEYRNKISDNDDSKEALEKHSQILIKPRQPRECGITGEHVNALVEFYSELDEQTK